MYLSISLDKKSFSIGFSPLYPLVSRSRARGETPHRSCPFFVFLQYFIVWEKKCQHKLCSNLTRAIRKLSRASRALYVSENSFIHYGQAIFLASRLGSQGGRKMVKNEIRCLLSGLRIRIRCFCMDPDSFFKFLWIRIRF